MKKTILGIALSFLFLTSCTTTAGAGNDWLPLTDEQAFPGDDGRVGSFEQKLPSGRTVECVATTGYTVDSGNSVTCDWDGAK